MTIELLREMVEKAAYVFNRISKRHPVYEFAYNTWYLLEKELRELELENELKGREAE